MSIFKRIFQAPLYPRENRSEVKNLTTELISIGTSDDYLSERPGGGFNAQCRNIRARQIGVRLDEIGGFSLMEDVYRTVRKKNGAALAAHLEYAWSDIGKWLP